MLPLKADKNAQEMYKRRGIDPSTVETHFNPGTPHVVIQFYISLMDKILKLNKLDENSPEYSELEKSIENETIKASVIIRQNPGYRPAPGCIPLDSLTNLQYTPVTGFVGVRRDCLIKSDLQTRLEAQGWKFYSNVSPREADVTIPEGDAGFEFKLEMRLPKPLTDGEIALQLKERGFKEVMIADAYDIHGNPIEYMRAIYVKRK